MSNQKKTLTFQFLKKRGLKTRFVATLSFNKIIVSKEQQQETNKMKKNIQNCESKSGLKEGVFQEGM